MPALHAWTPRVVVVNLCHGPNPGKGWRLDTDRSAVPVGQGGTTLSR